MRGVLQWQYCWIIMLCPVLAQVEVLPTDPIRSERAGANAVFTCVLTGRRAFGILWVINNTLLENHIEGVTESVIELADSLIGVLVFSNLPIQYNMTTIQCGATIFSGVTILSINNVTLLVTPGYRPLVAYLTVNVTAITLYWTVPIINGVDPAISGYCVRVVDETLNLLLLTKCGINETEFTYLLPSQSWCSVYLFSVNVSNSAGNFGEHDTQAYHGADTLPEVIEALRTRPATAATTFTYLLIMSAPVCTGQLTFVDLDAGEIITGGNNDLMISENNITFTAEQLTVNRHYNNFVSAANIAGLVISDVKISTHDVEDVFIAESNDGIEVTIIYSEDSDARGALVNFMFINSTFTQSTFVALDKTSTNYTIPFVLFSGLYRIFVYDIEWDGTLSNGVGYPAVTTLFTNRGDTYSQGPFFQPTLSYINNCSITTEVDLIVAECTYPSNSTATGFQLIAQLSDSSRAYKLFVNQTMDHQTPATVLVEESGTYQVSIFAIREGMGILGTKVQYMKLATTTQRPDVNGTTHQSNSNIISIVFGILFGIVTVIAAILAILLLKRYRATSTSGSST